MFSLPVLLSTRLSGFSRFKKAKNPNGSLVTTKIRSLVQPASPRASPPPGRAPRPGHRSPGRRRAPAPAPAALRPPPAAFFHPLGELLGLGPSACPAARASRRAHRGARAPRSPLFLDRQPGAVAGRGCRSSCAPANCTAACCQARRARGLQRLDRLAREKCDPASS